jgi:phosphoribosylpyrophosphate synthetase
MTKNVKFNVRKFSSGEYEVTIDGRIYGNQAVIHWNYFNEEEKDVYLLLLKINAVKTNYPNLPIIVDAPYLPYMRQDRIFNAGQGVPATFLVDTLHNAGVNKIRTYGCHSYQQNVDNWIMGNSNLLYQQSIIFPDANASKHYNLDNYPQFCFEKVRVNNEPKLVLKKDDTLLDELNLYSAHMIYDDIISGGRTFIECAKQINEFTKQQSNIELTVYNAFLDYGIENLKEAGIKRINIINKDSFDYVIKLYPNDTEYFNLIEFKHGE